MERPLVFADGPDSPSCSPGAVASVASLATSNLLLGWTPRFDQWLDDIPNGGAFSAMAGYALAEPIARGAVRYLPQRLSILPTLLRTTWRPTVLVVRGYPSPEGLRYYGSLGWAHGAARFAQEVIVEVDGEGVGLTTPLIEGNITTTLETQSRAVECEIHDLGPVERSIGEYVASLIQSRSTLEVGPGALGDAVLAALRTPVTIFSGVVSESVMELAARGLVLGPVKTAYLWGGSRLREFAAAGNLEICPLEETHDFARMAATKNFVAVNTALQVGLDGAVNVEAVGGRWVGGVGGHADFSLGARLSEGGRSVVALRSTIGGHSTIVPSAQPVTTGRSDVDTVITEHGIAELRELNDEQRALRLIEVAAPEHRDGLRRAFTSKLT